MSAQPPAPDVRLRSLFTDYQRAAARAEAARTALAREIVAMRSADPRLTVRLIADMLNVGSSTVQTWITHDRERAAARDGGDG